DIDVWVSGKVGAAAVSTGDLMGSSELVGIVPGSRTDGNKPSALGVGERVSELTGDVAGGRDAPANSSAVLLHHVPHVSV
ncbi:MAG: hypothetical protein OXF75_13010, partial [Acidimicrobiaceae bacterium]|nr:hypothetical protein [Acidimicrobiaceae bacterium]